LRNVIIFEVIKIKNGAGKKTIRMNSGYTSTIFYQKCGFLSGTIYAISSMDAAVSSSIIFNTDQGCQFTSEAFSSVLKTWNVKISIDGKGRFKDNIFIERLWRTLKYERINLKSYETGTELSGDLTFLVQLV